MTNNINLYSGNDVDDNIGVTNINTNSVGTNNVSFPDTSGTVALTSDIPTELSELTDDSAHRLVTDTQISTWIH